MDISNLSAENLLDLYALFVRVNHYDPFHTDPEYLKWSRVGVTEDVLRREILSRI